MSPHFCGSIFLRAFVPTSPASKCLQAAGLAEKMQEPDFLRVLGCAGQSGHMYCQQEEGVGVAGDTAEAMGPEAPCVCWSARTVPRLARLAPPTLLVVGRGGVPAGEPATTAPEGSQEPEAERAVQMGKDQRPGLGTGCSHGGRTFLYCRRLWLSCDVSVTVVTISRINQAHDVPPEPCLLCPGVSLPASRRHACPVASGAGVHCVVSRLSSSVSCGHDPGAGPAVAMIPWNRRPRGGRSQSHGCPRSFLPAWPGGSSQAGSLPQGGRPGLLAPPARTGTAVTGHCVGTAGQL